MKVECRALFLLFALLAMITGNSYATLGACCIYPTYDCYLLTEEMCDQHGGVWFEGSCDPNP